VVAGETETLAPVKAPGFHVYVVAPVADNVVELPEQIVDDEALAFTVGVMFTNTVTVLVLVQPAALDPKTV
jgi:hypothetical protein